jgi:hypothetical protein
MRSMRCDACGNKALMAASQCPSCGHLFEVRDGFGDLFPLAFCSSCDSYYPERVGSCKWCGTTPEPPPNAPRVWKIVGAVAVAGLVGVTWLLRDAGEAPAAKVEQQADPVVQTAPTAVAPVAAVVPTAPSSEIVETPPAIEATPSVDSSVVAPPPPKVKAAASRWVNSVARDWAIIRAGPSKQTRITASVGPGARVQLGESQGTWRRIRARGIAGWVEPRASFADVAPSSARARAVVSR